MFDVIIIGLGPAGATLARLLDPSLKVAVIDKKSLDGSDGFKKPCGGLLAPDAQKIFAKLGISIPKDIMADPQIFAVRTLDLKYNLEQYYQRAYVNINRHKFDLWLASLIPSGITVIDNSVCKSITQNSDDSFKVKYTTDGEENELTGKYIVGSDGATSIVRKTFCPTPIRQYISIQQSYKLSEESTPYFTCFFHPDYTDCYGWVNVKDGLMQLGAALPFGNSKQLFKDIHQHMLKLGFPLENPEKLEACLVNRPSSTKQLEIGSNNVFLIGEAAGFVSPSSLEGISYAMGSGVILSDVLNSGTKAPNKEYKRKSKKLRFRIFLKLIKSPFMYFPPLRWLVMRSGITSMKVR